MIVSDKYKLPIFEYTDNGDLVEYSKEMSNGVEKVLGTFKDGVTFVPSVAENGDISWTNDKELDNPETTNIKGPKGEKGDQGEQGIQGEKGDTGDNGATFVPSVAENGDISWTNDKGLDNPETTNIKGPKGEKGDKGEDGYTPVKGIDYFTPEDIANLDIATKAYLNQLVGDIESSLAEV